jgi:hypothetical protein
MAQFLCVKLSAFPPIFDRYKYDRDPATEGWSILTNSIRESHFASAAGLVASLPESFLIKDQTAWHHLLKSLYPNII